MRRPELVDLVRQDLVRDLRQPHTGRDGLTAEQTLRAYVLKHVKNWDLRELRDRTADGLTLRALHAVLQCPRAHAQGVPPRVLSAARPRPCAPSTRPWCARPWRRGSRMASKLRSDTTVVETNIHFPTDSGLLWDGVRVLTRLVGRLQALRPDLAIALRQPHAPGPPPDAGDPPPDAHSSARTSRSPSTGP